ncbi:MAG: T9SS type A sorting domain-containing protein [Bacteroidia bacterium]
MKRLLLLSITLFIKLNALAQINPNSETEFYVLRIGPADYFATGLWSHVDGFRDKTQFDSIKGDTTYYSVSRTGLINGDCNKNYQLLTADSSWYFKGKIKTWDDSVLTQQVIYDYKLNAGDTIANKALELDGFRFFNCSSVIQNTDSILIADSIYIKTQQYAPNDSCFESMTGFYHLEACGDTFSTYYYLGSSAGLIPYNIDRIGEYWGGPPNTLLLSACEKGELLHVLPCIKEKFSSYNLCDSAQVAEVIEQINVLLSTSKIQSQTISVYPNPAMNTLKIEGAEEFTFQIMALSGKTVLSGYSQKQIDISNLPSGVYHLSLVLNETVLNTQFVKN